jgi:thiol-disulfide isomerase/thioredoxin
MQAIPSQVPDRAPLGQELRQFQEQLARQLPSDVHARLSAAIDDLVKSKPAAAALQVGQSAPDFTLPDLAAHPVTLTEQLLGGPVVLTFYRGSWCPYCDLQLRAYSRMVPLLARAGAQIIAISPQRAEAQLPNATEHRGLGFSVLTDENTGSRVSTGWSIRWLSPCVHC